MATLNLWTGIGNLGKDPESRGKEGGKSFTTFSIATEDYIGKDENGKAKTKTTWHNITVFGPQAEWAAKNLKKGMQVYVSGPISTSEKDGKVYTNILANTVILSNVRSGNASGDSSSSSSSSSSSATTQAPPPSTAPVSTATTQATSVSVDQDDLDLPF